MGIFSPRCDLARNEDEQRKLLDEGERGSRGGGEGKEEGGREGEFSPRCDLARNDEEQRKLLDEGGRGSRGGGEGKEGRWREAGR